MQSQFWSLQICCAVFLNSNVSIERHTLPASETFAMNASDSKSEISNRMCPKSKAVLGITFGHTDVSHVVHLDAIKSTDLLSICLTNSFTDLLTHLVAF